MQEGLGAVVIDKILILIKRQAIHACICKKTKDVLVLQFNQSDTIGYSKVYDFILDFDVEFRIDIDGTVKRINLYIGEERIVTVAMDNGGIDVFEVEEKTGFLIRPKGAAIANIPYLAKPSADFLDSYREASREAYGMGYRGFTPDPSNDDVWRTLLEDLRNEDVATSSATYTYWLIHDDEYVGSIRIRQRLTKELYDNLGCCCSFEVRPTLWRRGYAKVMLALALKKSVERGVDMLLCGVEKSNIAAVKALEKNGAMRFTESKEDIRYFLPACLLLEKEVDFSRFV